MVKEAKLSPVRRIALDGMLCALAIVGRWALGALPNIQPVTVILILMAIYIGIWDSAASAVVIVTVTNMIMGIGIWSLYQMFAWALIGVVSGLLFKKYHPPLLILLWSGAMGFVYGFTVSIFAYRSFVTNGGTGGLIAYWLSGLPFDGFHALGNAVFVWFLQPVFAKLTKKTA